MSDCVPVPENSDSVPGSPTYPETVEQTLLRLGGFRCDQPDAVFAIDSTSLTGTELWKTQCRQRIRVLVVVILGWMEERKNDIISPKPKAVVCSTPPSPMPSPSFRAGKVNLCRSDHSDLVSLPRHDSPSADDHFCRLSTDPALQGFTATYGKVPHDL